MSEYKLKRHEIEKLGITTNNTQVERIPQTKGGEWTIVTLHSTDIVKFKHTGGFLDQILLDTCLLYTSPSPRDRQKSRMPSSA